MQKSLLTFFLILQLFLSANIFAADSDKLALDNYSRIFESTLGGGVAGLVDLSMSQTAFKPDINVLPYGKLHLRFLDGKPFVPEIEITESGMFNFDRGGFKIGSKEIGYGEYYLKLPLMLKIPFFSYESMFNIDAMYAVYSTTGATQADIVIDDQILPSNTKVSMRSSIMQVRLFLDTPIVLHPNIFAYSYFGIYYSEDYTPRTITPPTSGGNRMLLDILTRHGGIFYEIRKDTPLRGLNFNVLIQAGYGWGFPVGRRALLSPKFGNLESLLVFHGKAGLSYRYEFTKNFGLSLDASVSYKLNTNFFTEADTSRYTANLGGILQYGVTLNFLFAY